MNIPYMDPMGFGKLVQSWEDREDKRVPQKKPA